MTRAALLAPLASALLGCSPAAPPPPPAPAVVVGLAPPPRPSATPPVASSAAPPPRAPARSAPRLLFSPCEGETAVPEFAARLLAQRQESAEHCELHQLSPAQGPLLFVRTMSTVAHDDDGHPSPVCSWSLFQLSPPNFIGTLGSCEFIVDGACLFEIGNLNLQVCY